MPPGGKLSEDEIAVLKAWIDSVAEWDSSVKTHTRQSGRVKLYF